MLLFLLGVLIKAAGGGEEELESLLFIQPQRARIGPDKSFSKDFGRKAREILFFKGLEVVRLNSRLGSDLIQGHALPFPCRSEKSPQSFHGIILNERGPSRIHVDWPDVK
jgi:hypothetical protein